MSQRAAWRGIEMLLITVHPRHAAFYHRFFSFEPMGARATYESVCNQPAVCMALNLTRLESRNRRAFRRVFGRPFAARQIELEPVSAALRHQVHNLVVTIDAHSAASRAA
jgi:hypothetical protein